MNSRFDQLAERLFDQSIALWRECEALPKESSPEFDGWWEALERTSRQSSAETDTAARALAAGTLAPLPPPLICAFLCLRLEMAACLLARLGSSDNAPRVIAFPKALDEMPDSQIVEWLLVDFWHGLGKHLWPGVGYWEWDLWQYTHPDDLGPRRLSDDQFAT